MGFTKFQADVLAAISKLESNGEECYGLAIKEVVENMAEYDDVHPGRLYPNLRTLVENGWIQKGTIDRRTNSYSLSSEGEKVLDRLSGRYERE